MSRAALQGLLIYSPDRTAFLLAYYTGKLLLVNTASFANDPYFQNPKTVIWSSGTSGSPTPMNLVMQEVRLPLFVYLLASLSASGLLVLLPSVSCCSGTLCMQTVCACNSLSAPTLSKDPPPRCCHCCIDGGCMGITQHACHGIMTPVPVAGACAQLHVAPQPCWQ